MQQRLAIGLAFLSGFVALGYEILWAQRLSDIIGATSLASSLVVGVFFLLLAAGAALLGPAAARRAAPWRMYALLELGILVAILPAFFGEALSGLLMQGLGESLLQPVASLAVKTLLALVFVGPAAFLMGGTLPAMGQAVVRSGRLGNEGNILYGTNTLGGAAGTLVATFVLIPDLGMRTSFLALMLGSLVVAATAWRLAGVAPRPTAGNSRDARTIPPPAAVSSRFDRAWLVIAFISGFDVLGLEILSLHLFSQVLHNSTYTFATVLVVVIAALAVGALVTQRWRLDAESALRRVALALLLAGAVTALLPRAFFALTGGMAPLGGGVPSLGGYVLRILAAGTLLLGPPFVLAGWVYPLVLAGAGASGGEVGSRWGRLLGANAVGALLGLVLANFVCMRFLGLWLSLGLWSAVMVGAGSLVALYPERRLSRSAGIVAGIAIATLLLGLSARLPIASLAPGEAVLGWSAGADGVAAVVSNASQHADRRIKWNNHYTLGGLANAAQQARLGHLPLLLHPHPRRVGFIGIATGITASAALHDPAPASITAVELSKQITKLACRHFADANGDLCAAPRVRVVVEDGRMFFRATRDSFDVVVGDLFVPWQAGTANLYTREHFEALRARLASGGLFAQWLPLFQLDAEGFWGIAATFCRVFPNAWLVLADFQPYAPAVALVGWRESAGGPSYEILERRCREIRALSALHEPTLATAAGAGMYLVGPVAPALPPGTRIMTLDRPWLADHAPRTQRMQPPPFLVGPGLVTAFESIVGHAPDGPLREPMTRGQQLFQFCEIFDREGPQSAARWFDAHVQVPLPRDIFAPLQPESQSWPFTMQTGLFLISRARMPSPQ
jgi:spermidine synthase